MDRNTKDTSFVRRALGTAIDETTVYAKVQALGPRKITWDERVNYLIVTASASDLAKIKEIISKLDVVLAQVLVEAAIIEFPLEGTNNVVPYLNSREGRIPPSLIALTNFAGLSSTPFVLNELTNRSGSRGGLLTYEAVITSDLDTLQSGLGTHGGKTLQRPRIQTSDGVPATFWVGRVRVPPQMYYGGGAYCGCGRIEQLEGGVSLDLTCGIVGDDFILTDIKQRVDEFAVDVNIQNVGSVPTYNSRTSEGHIGVRKGEVIALNVIENVKESVFSEVPALEKVPLAGHLLNRIITNPTHTKRYELMVLIRPIILPTPEIQAALTRRDRMPSIKELE